MVENGEKMYKMNMSSEVEPKKRILLDEGWRIFNIRSCEDSVSKGGNEMLVIDLLDKITNSLEKVYLVTVPGKRWGLKNLLDACNIQASQDGVYEFERKDLMGKEVAGLVEHQPNEYINRSGETVKTIQHKIVKFGKPDEEIAWDT
jgi:hypothetical protein